jgi:triosephosphate isomerase (TIM)
MSKSKDSASRRLFVAGNWKMNLLRQSAVDLAQALARELPDSASSADVAVCPPSPYLSAVGAALAGSRIALGAQNAYHELSGAFTGEVSPGMLLDNGCRWVILGHSERRWLMGETDDAISRKVEACTGQGLGVILCVGETLEQRQSSQTDRVLDGQMQGSLARTHEAAMARLVIAYEPVWAIGTGLTATTEQAQSAHRHLRTWLASRYNQEVAGRTRILYGGSVKADNASGLLSQPDVDGALVGGASLKAGDFLSIVRAAESATKN